MATHPSILAWRMPLDRGAWWAIVQRAGHDLATKHHHQVKPGSPTLVKRPSFLILKIQTIGSPQEDRERTLSDTLLLNYARH